jgi:hemerythrin-like domain-containing protein
MERLLLNILSIAKDGTMSIYEALKKDHTKVKQLLNQIISYQGENDEPPARLIEQVRDELIPHARAEEAVFYNSLRTLKEGQDAIQHAYREHLEAETLLRTLQVQDKIEMGWRDTAKKLLSSLTHHIDEEENEIFPVAKRLFTTEEAVMMEQAFEKLKLEVKDHGLLQTSIEFVTNMMPERFVPAFKSINLGARI